MPIFFEAQILDELKKTFSPCAVPMILQDAPASLHGIVFAVVRRIVQKLNRLSDIMR